MAYPVDGVENSNYSRLACLVMQEGTDRVRTHVLRNLEGGQTLKLALASKKEELTALKKKCVISGAQYATLYPGDNQKIRISRIDMTLWLFLARNLTTGRKSIKWNSSPGANDVKWQHDSIRIREIRNQLFHRYRPDLPDDVFGDLLFKVRGPLLRLGTHQDVIHNHLTRELDPVQTRICMLQVFIPNVYINMSPLIIICIPTVGTSDVLYGISGFPPFYPNYSKSNSVAGHCQVVSKNTKGCREQPPRGAPWVSGLVGHFVQTYPDSECAHTVQFLDRAVLRL